MRSASIIALAAATLLALGCTQWGGSQLRRSEIWWACTDRYAACSSEDALLTLIQMDNTLAGARRDLAQAKDGKARERLRAAILRAEEMRRQISQPPSWTTPGEATCPLAEYVRAVVDAERLAQRTLPWRS